MGIAVVLLEVLDAPWWLVLVIVLLPVGAVAVMRTRLRSAVLHENVRGTQAQPVIPPQPVQLPPPATVTVEGLVLPSAQRDYRFLLGAVVTWRPASGQGIYHPRPAQVAVDAVRERATHFLEGVAAADCDVVAPRLAMELSHPRPDRTGQLEVWAADVVLSIPDHDRERLDKLAKVRKDEEVWEHERAYERNKRAYLKEDVLTTTGSAVVWWLSRDTTRIQETVELVSTLAKLVAAAQDREVEPVFREFVERLVPETPMRGPDLHLDLDLAPEPAPRQDAGDLVEKLMATYLPDGTEPDRVGFAAGLANLATEFGATDLAEAIRDRFDAPDFTADATAVGAPDGAPPDSPNGNGQSSLGFGPPDQR